MQDNAEIITVICGLTCRLEKPWIVSQEGEREREKLPKRRVMVNKNRMSTPSHAVQSEMVFGRRIRYQSRVCQYLQTVEVNRVESICNKGHRILAD